MKSFPTIIAAVIGVTVCSAEPHHHTAPSVMIKSKLRAGAVEYGAFDDFMSTFTKSYSSEEEKMHRFGVFKKNLKFINAHNADTTKSYTLGINKFADLTHAEFKMLYLGVKKPQSTTPRKVATWLSNVQGSEIPDEVDWKKKGCVTDVKDQGSCGSCWAFSSTGALEGQECAVTKKLISMSEQQLVDCSSPEGNQGCGGGLMDQAFQYVEKFGICTEDSYPYTAQNGKCHANSCTSALKNIDHFIDVPKMNSTALQAALAKTGPISIGIHACDAFQFYKAGVFDTACGHDLNHGVLVVGYGHDEQAKEDFWLVKNSWGTAWGDKGYIKMVRNGSDKNGECGLLEDPSFPIINKDNLVAPAEVVSNYDSIGIASAIEA